MDYYECSAKNGFGVDKIFTETATEIAKKVDEGMYDIFADSSGVKMGIGAEKYRQKVQLHNRGSKGKPEEKKSCC